MLLAIDAGNTNVVFALVEAGTIQVFVGGSSLADQVGEAEILKTVRIPPMERRASASTSVAQ